ncbi:MAG: ABC transporter permease, partial [Actinobacteria bacterium]|nr:ABC transporter permease [Actinomycetota bacterium]
MYFKLALGNVKRSFRDYAVYFLTLVLGVCVFYAFNSMSQQHAVLQMSEIQNNMMELLSTLINGVSIFLSVILGFLITYANRFLIRRRKKEFGMYLVLGMDKSKVSRIIVLEALLVGIVSLAVGLLLGIALSQGLLYLTAALFEIKIDVFMFVFSLEAYIKTILYFAIIFTIALIFNVLTVSKYSLIDLLNADKVSENVKLRSLPLSVVLFVISLVMIGIAYKLLIENGLTQISPEFIASTVLVCIGTVLFFFSLSGFLLRVVQSNKKLYYSGLNMFTLRQLNSKVNTTFISIGLVCMTLFLALTSTCGGLAICASFNSDLEKITVYDASFCAFYKTIDALDGSAEGTQASSDQIARAEADDYDMVAALERDVPEYSEYVAEDAQVDFYYSDVTFGDVMAVTDYELNSSFDADSMRTSPVTLVS